VVATHGLETPYTFPSGTQVLWLGGDMKSGNLGSNSSTAAWVADELYPNTGSANVQSMSPWNLHGAYFTGLDPNTTLQLTIRYGIARAPTLDEADLTVLASDSPSYDPMALELYSRAVRDAPPGVPVSENFLGEWFSKVVDGVSSAASLAAPLVGAVHPIAGKALGMAGGVGKAFVEKRKKKVKK